MTGAVHVVHQFVPTLEPGAVGGHTLEIRRTLHELGAESEIFAEHVHPSMAGLAHDYLRYGRKVAARADDVLLYQMAIGSPVADFVRRRPQRKAVDHHNITPPEFFARWEPDLVHGLAWGRHQLAELAGCASFALADSAFNEAELRALGYRDTAVVPILFDPAVFEREVDEGLLGRLGEAKAAGGADLLFVGRLAPNKAQHDLVKALAAYRRVYDPRARLHLVGGASSEVYVETLRAYAHALGLDDAVDLAGSVPDAQLAAYYRSADVFVSASEHEGFCVPLLEAMHHRVPIVAYAAAAVPETLARAGILLASKAPARVAAAVARVVADRALRASLAEAGAARLEDFSLARSRARLVEALRRFGAAA
ncbi:MAG: glycosyltransferase [Acidimicrobiia bacterium]|nr:glycosyltransferase [Acidimicrobiia bacterium]